MTQRSSAHLFLHLHFHIVHEHRSAILLVVLPLVGILQWCEQVMKLLEYELAEQLKTHEWYVLL